MKTLRMRNCGKRWKPPRARKWSGKRKAGWTRGWSRADAISPGQRQRLTIARALVRKPDILILDDSASALDYATDLALRRAIAELPGGMTIFIISQRASSVRAADRILVLDDGRAAGFDTHNGLMAGCAVYREIYYSQYPEEKPAAGEGAPS
jgi:ABC-type multidrug transport system fused ATPase/permease subunit